MPLQPFRRLAPVRPPFSENGTTRDTPPVTTLNPQRRARLATVSRATTMEATRSSPSPRSSMRGSGSRQSTPTGSRWYQPVRLGRGGRSCSGCRLSRSPGVS